MVNTRGVPLFASTALLLGACAGPRLQYAPMPAPEAAETREVISLPSTGGWSSCLNEIAAVNHTSAVRAALVLYCAESTSKETVPSRDVRSAVSGLARLAYDPAARTFVDRRLARNVVLVTRVEPEAAHFFADDFVAEGMSGSLTIPGPNLPLVTRTDRGTDGIDDFYPPEGLFEPAVLSASVSAAGDRQLRITLSSVDALPPDGPWRAALAEQAYLHLLDAAELGKASWTGFVNPQEMTSHTDGIYLIERYDPDRIPILMIHGLRSSPLAWEELTQAILASPDLHKRFQVWHAFYPTGLPPFYTGSRTRLALRAVLEHFDPEGGDLPSRHIAVIGHSMGGLVAHMLVSDDAGALWRETFTTTPAELEVDAALRTEFVEIFRARHEPQVGFVAFIAAPHRGSDTADRPIGVIGSSLVELPVRFTSLFTEDRDYLDQTTEAMRPYLDRGGPDSIRVLSPDHPLLRVLAELPVTKGVEHVSVIGVTDGAECVKDPLCIATDGVVTYESARFSPPEDEKIIRAGHDVQRHPEAIAFLLERLGSWNPE